MERDLADVTGVDAYSPAQIAMRVETAGVSKSYLPLEKLFVLGLLAGIFIALGGAFYTVTITGSTLGFGPTKVIGGVAFSLGLILVIIAGAELFTGNALIVMAWADGKATTVALLRNWAVTFISNGLGAVLIAWLMFSSGSIGNDGVRATAIAIAEAKISLSFQEAFARGLLCNALVCLAVWLSFAARRVSGKILAIVFPITAFVALGFEHSIANFYLITIGLLAGADGGVIEFAGNIVPVTLGNIVGGAGGVAATYWVVYRRSSD